MKRIIFVLIVFSALCIASLHVRVPTISATSAVPKGAEVNQVNRFVKKIVDGGWIIYAISATDGDYLTLSRSPTSSGFVIRKIKSSGKIVWSTLLQLNVGSLNAIAETKDGYVLAGSTAEPGFFYYYYYFYSPILIKLDGNGKVFEQSIIRGSESRVFSQLVANPDGTYIAVGDSSIVMKFRSVHDIQWKKTFRFNSNVCCLLSQRTPDNSLILARAARGGAELMKIGTFGAKIWSNRVQISKFVFHALGVTSNNGVVLAGKCNDCSDLMLVALDAQGKLSWTARYSLNIASFGISNVSQTHDGGYAVTGDVIDKAGSPHAGFFLKIDSSRNVVFQSMFGAPHNWEGGTAIFNTVDDGYVVFGSSGRRDSLFLNLNSHGTISGCAFFEPLNSVIIPFGEVIVDHSSISVSSNADVSTANSNISSQDLNEQFVNICS
jgi:hypothetical protein